uniref:F-box protein n=1 Tax=Chenopodium quinoa TaxID=63459 RepID=A0A803M6E3_CHEQI
MPTTVNWTTDIGLVYGNDKECLVTGYSDSDYAADVDTRRSVTGYVFTLGGSVVNWKSTLQSSITLSTNEAKYMALTSAAQESIWLKSLVVWWWGGGLVTGVELWVLVMEEDGGMRRKKGMTGYLERMAGDWSSAESWLGSLCHPPSRAAHHVVQEATQLPAAAGESSSRHNGQVTRYDYAYPFSMCDAGLNRSDWRAVITREQNFVWLFTSCNLPLLLYATREWISLRLPQEYKLGLGRAFAFTFAFDPQLSFTLVGIQFSLDKPDFCSFVIYKSKLKMWRVSREFMCCASWIRPESHAFVSDRCHWITYNLSCNIGTRVVCEGFYMVVFDIRKESCQVIKLPHITSDEYNLQRRCCLGENNSRIHYVCAYKYEVKILQLKDYNEPPHWVPAAFRFPCLADYMEVHWREDSSKLGRHYPRDGDNKDLNCLYFKPLYLYNDILFIAMPGTLCTYNLRSRKQVLDFSRPLAQFFLDRMCLIYSPTIYMLKTLDARGSPVEVHTLFLHSALEEGKSPSCLQHDLLYYDICPGANALSTNE